MSVVDPDEADPVVQSAPEPVRRPKQTDARLLSEIQADLREETARRARGEFRGAPKRRQV